MLNLPDVTLVMIETREHALALMALEECEKKAKFGDILVFTDQVSRFLSSPRHCYAVPDWPDKLGWSKFLWNNVAPFVTTSHLLVIQWDSWIKDPDMWRDDFLKYDYVGAPWWYKDGKNVGNGGFSLRSTALQRYVRKHRGRFPCISNLDDDLLCRKYRLALEEAGFVWAPQEVAADFAFECVRPNPNSKHFGFHAMFNWGEVLPPDELLKRAQIASQSDYIKNNSHMWSQFAQRNPTIIEQLGAVA